MASTEFLTQAYLAYFGRPADPGGLAYFASASESDVGIVFSSSAESQALYGSSFGYDQINQIYNTLFGRDADLPGLEYWYNEIVSGNVTPAQAAVVILQSVLIAAPTSADAIAVGNKLAASEQFTADLNTTAEYLGYAGSAATGSARNFLSTITSTPATAAEVQAAVLAATSSEVPTTTIALTTGYDNLVGTVANDTFDANVVQNVNGEQTNQLATGDRLAGGAGDDTLAAVVQVASPLNGGPMSGIAPETVNVEHALFTALSVSNWGLVDESETVVINAKSMLGLTEVGSVQSDASLLIQNLTTLTNDGIYENRRDTEAVTIRMDHSGNDVAVDAESNMTVLFDNDYLVAGANSLARAFFYVLDEKAELARLDGDLTMPRLNEINVDGIRFSLTIDGVTTTHTLADRASWEANAMDTHQGFVDALQNEVAAMIASGELPAGTTLTLDLTITDVTYLDDGSRSDPIPAIVLNVPGGATVTPLGFDQLEDVLGNFDVYGDFGNLATITANPIIATIELEKVGRGAEGGDLTVGAMSTDFANVLNYSDSAIKEGVEQFNITVSGDQTQFSDLASLQSTNNTLEVVDVKWATGSVADLIIGNHNTAGVAPNGASATSDDDVSSYMNNGLKDVLQFTATNNNALVGTVPVTTDVSVHAYVSDEAVAKYMDLTDTAENASIDNADFEYSFGAGNDLLNLNISKTNLAQSGTTNREDFSFTATMGNGDDTVETQIGDGTGVETDHWYVNSTQNGNLSIETGAGDDIVRTFGAGSWNVQLGADNDVIYSDNSGNQLNNADDMGTDTDGVNFNSGRAVWVLNTDDQTTAMPAARDIDNLRTDSIEEFSFYNTELTVNLRGLTATVAIDTYTMDDLQLNNAIKDAVLNDNVLSKLIAVEDGPAGTLVIRSLTDGVFDAADFTVSISNPSAVVLSPAEIAEFNTANGTTFATSAEVQAQVTADVAAWTLQNDYDTALANDGLVDLTGSASTAATASVIYDGTGEDVIVLSTSGLDTETVYLTADNQRDVIYNVQNAEIYGLSQTLSTDGLTVVSQDEVVLADGTHYNYANLFAMTSIAGSGATLNADLTIDLVVNGGGVIPPPGVTVVTLPSPSTATITAVAGTNERFDFNAVAAKAIAADTQIAISAFDVVNDTLRIDTTTASPAVLTLDQLNGIDGITVTTNVITNETDINFGPDADGTAVVIALNGILDATLVHISVI